MKLTCQYLNSVVDTNTASPKQKAPLLRTGILLSAFRGRGRPRHTLSVGSFILRILLVVRASRREKPNVRSVWSPTLAHRTRKNGAPPALVCAGGSGPRPPALPHQTRQTADKQPGLLELRVGLCSRGCTQVSAQRTGANLGHIRPHPPKPGLHFLCQRFADRSVRATLQML